MSDQKYRIVHEGVGSRTKGEIVQYPDAVDTDRLLKLNAIEPLYGPDADQDAIYDDTLATQLIAREAAGDHSHDGREIERRKVEAERELNDLLRQKAQAEADAARARAAAEAAALAPQSGAQQTDETPDADQPDAVDTEAGDAGQDTGADAGSGAPPDDQQTETKTKKSGK